MINHIAISANLTWLTVIAVMVFVLLKGKGNRLVVGFSLYMANIAIWSFCVARMAVATDPASGLFWGRALHIGAIIVPVTFFHFALLFQDQNYSRQWSSAVKIGYGIAIFFLSISFTKYFVAYAVPSSNILFFPQPGIFYLPYVVFFGVYVGFAFWTLVHAYKNAMGLKKIQLKYVLLAYMVAYGGGIQSFLPVFGLKMVPFALCGVPICMCILAYAVFVHHLLDVNVIIRKTVIYSLFTGVLAAIVLFVSTVLAHVSQGFLGRGSLLASAVAACLITIVFHPLQRKIQAFVDRYFFRDWSERGEMVREVAAGFSHELKSPLTGLSMQVQMTLAHLEEIEKDPDTLKGALPRIKEELHYMLNKAMDAARRIEAVRGVAEPSGDQSGPVDLAAVLDASLSVLSPLLKEVDVKVRRAFPENLPAVKGNVKQLEIVFINLMKNALEAMDGSIVVSHTLTLSGFEQDGAVIVSVKDTGAGIDYRDRERIFEPHYTTKGRKGTGMGLFLTQQIVKAHSGTIDVKSDNGKGTEFLVSLPKFIESAAA